MQGKACRAYTTKQVVSRDEFRYSHGKSQLPAYRKQTETMRHLKGKDETMTIEYNIIPERRTESIAEINRLRENVQKLANVVEHLQDRVDILTSKVAGLISGEIKE